MVKYLFVLIQTITFFIFNLLSGDTTVTVNHNLPSNMVIGEEVIVEFKINKGKLDGFARFQFEFPEGITVKPIENKGGEFELEETIAKWVWAILPEEDELILKCSISANEKAIGSKKINAKFSYLEDNVKKTIDIPTHELEILATKDLTANKTETINLTTSKIKDSLAKMNEKLNTQSISNAEPIGTISVVRTVSDGINKNERLVVLKIKKGLTKGFARFSDDIEQGLIAKAIKVDGSTFSVADGKIKFVWVNSPEKEDLEISYILIGNLKSDFVLNGEFSYLENNQSKKITLSPQSITFNKSVNDTVAKVDATLINQVETLTLKSVKEEPKKQIIQEHENPNSEKENSANFSIQIGAFTNGKIEAKQLKQKFKIKEIIKSEMQGGFSKFLIGKHSDYKAARLHKDEVVNVNGIKSAFVTAYNDGKRITVQEALMINNQKWFK